MTRGPALAYRLAEDRDMALVVDSWVDSYRTAHAAGMIPMPMYKESQRANVRWVLARPGVEVWVAYHPGESPESRADLYGWIAVERGYSVPRAIRQRVGGELRWVEELRPCTDPLVHYVFVKESYREHGIAAGLFRAARVDRTKPFLFTCKTGVLNERLRRDGPTLLERHPLARWSPLIARYPKT